MEGKFTRLTLEQSDRKIVIEVPYEDVTGEDMCNAFYAIMTGMTFLPITTLIAMRDFYEDNIGGCSED